jgi:hypothetical protein
LTWFDWNDPIERKTEFIGTTGKPDHRKAGITGKLELPESWNVWEANTTGMLELTESWKDRKEQLSLVTISKEKLSL